jgi:hypothetical protein
VLIRFFERDITNAGVGHEEYVDLSLLDLDGVSGVFKFKHYFYHADIEFAIMALSSLDRDLVADSVVQTIAMGTLEDYTNRFFNRIYPRESENQYPDSIWHYVNINSDQIQGFGEGQNVPVWGSEDDLVYQTSYRVRAFGEFYSVPPETPINIIEAVTQYPYIAGLEDVPTGDPDDGGQWVPPVTD